MKKSLLLVMMLLLIVPGSSFAKKVYKHSFGAAPRSLAPLKAGDMYSNEIITALYDTLYEYKYLKSPWELKPSLAEGMPDVSEDGLVYTINIKEGVHFIDDPCFPGGKGRELIAEDFVYSLRRHFDPNNISYGSWLWQDKIKGLDDWGKAGADYSKEIPGLKATGKYTIQIILNKPYPQLSYTLAMGYVAFVAKEAVEKYGEEMGVHPVGSGPYMLKSFNTKKVILVKNPGYRNEVIDINAEGYVESVHGPYGVKALDGKKLPIVDEIDISIIENLVPQWISLTKGDDIQFGEVPQEAMKKTIKEKAPNVVLFDEFTNKFNYSANLEFGYVYQNFNMDDPEIGYNADPERNKRNKALRKAMRKGFDWTERNRRFYLGMAEIFPGIIPPGVEGNDPDHSKDSITYDIEEAKKLLKDNGWNADNLPMLNSCSMASTRNNQFFEQFRGWMKKIGYPTSKIRHKTYATFGDFSKAVSEKQCQFYGMAWGLDYPDAQNVLQLYYGPYGAPGSNGSNFNNKEYNELYVKSSTMQPGTEREKIYKRMNDILIEECPMFSGLSRKKVFLWSKDVNMFYRRSPLGNVYKYVDVK